ncbi:MAG: class I SAM-dependent methyltransferase [Nakamurella sp.]
MNGDVDVFGDGRDLYQQWNRDLWDPKGAAAVAGARVVPGDRVLDACCGNGSSALPAAVAAGPTGVVDAVDLSPGLLAAGVLRARNADVATIRWHEQDTTRWAGADHDALVCNFGVFFLSDMDNTVRRLVGSLRPGGKVAITSWGSTAMQEFAPIMFDAIRSSHPAVVAPSSRNPAGRINSVEKMTTWMTSLGMDSVHSVDLPLRVTLTRESAWALVAGSGFRALLPADERVWPQIADELWSRCQNSGSTAVTLDAIVGTGRRTGGGSRG